MQKYLAIIKTLLFITLPFFFINAYTVTNSFQIPILGIIIYSFFSFYHPAYYLFALLFFIPFIPVYPLFIVLGLTILLRKYYLKNKLYLVIYILFSNLGVGLLNDGQAIDKIHLINFLLLSLMIMGLLETISIIKIEKSSIVKIKNIPFFNLLIIICTLIGSLSISRGLFLYLFATAILYLSLIKKKELSFFLAISMSFIYYYLFSWELIISIFILPIIFLFKNRIPYIIAIILGTISLTYHTFDAVRLVYMLAVLTIFLLSIILDSIYSYDESGSMLYVHENIISNVSDQLLSFASFLDEFERNFIKSYEYKRKFSECYNIILDHFCERCSKAEYCFSAKKNDTFMFLKSSLLYGKDIYVKQNPVFVKNIMKECLNNDAIINKANILKNKYYLNKEGNIFEQTLKTQISGISNTLRQYTIELTNNKEINTLKFVKLKNDLEKSGYHIIMYNVKKVFKNDFWIELGIEEIHDSFIPIITHLAYIALECFVEIKIHERTDNAIFFSILPKSHISITYGHGSLAKNSLNVTGDNYLIKDSLNNTFIAAISDGMGSGYEAYMESKQTLEMINRITEMHINPETSINMLNTFYSLKDNMNQYATLDYLEIDKANQKGIIYKLGSSTTYHVTNNEIKSIQNTNLPFGINDLIIKDEINLQDNDLIIIASDGINDNISLERFKKILTFSINKHPQKIAYEILEEMIKENPLTIDDMSLIVVKTNVI